MTDKKRVGILILGFFVVCSGAVFAAPASTKLVNIQTKATPVNGNSVTHHVGECYGGGVIFYVSKDPHASVGKQGLIVANMDVEGSFAWDMQRGANTVLDTQPVIFTGGTNTKTIISKIGAARAKAALATTSYTDGTYHDWFLPSQTELSTIYFQSIATGGDFWKKCGATPPSAATYWSSTESDAAKAWAVSFAGGVVVIADKNNPLLVRAVRAF